MVDYVVVFDEDTPEKLITEIQPNIHIKGGDWKPEEIPEAKTLMKFGGRLVIFPYRPRLSTTNIIKMIQKNSKEGDK